MVDPMIVHDLIYGDVEWPAGMDSDVAKLSWFAEENNVSLSELRDALKSFKERYSTEPGFRDWAVTIWLDTAEKAINRERRLVGNLPVLDTKLTGGPGSQHEYAATVNLKKDKYTPEGRYLVTIVQKQRDDEFGSMTGRPNAEYWSGTPGQYYATTLLGWDTYSSGRGGDVLCIDGGSNWCIHGMNKLRNEIEEKYGDKIKSHDLPQERKTYKNLDKMASESMRAMKVYEAMSDILAPKSEDQIEIELESYIDDLADTAIKMEEFDDFLDAREIFSRHKDKIKEMIQQDFSMEGILGTILYGWE